MGLSGTFVRLIICYKDKIFVRIFHGGDWFLQYNQLSDALGNIHEELPLGDFIGENICIVFVQLLFCDREPFDFHYYFGSKWAVEQIQGPGAGQSLHSGERTGHKPLTRAFGANQHLGYQIALEVQFVEDFGGVGMGPDHPAVFGFRKFLCDIDSQSAPKCSKTGV